MAGGKSGQKRTRARARVIPEIPLLGRAQVQHFLALLSEGHAVRHSVTACGLGRSTLYEWKDKDEQFALAWKQALDEGTEHYEEVARSRAVDGVKRPIMYKGEQVGELTEFSDELLKFILQARDPLKYRTRHEISGPGNTPLNPTSTPAGVTLVSLTIEGAPKSKKGKNP